MALADRFAAIRTAMANLRPQVRPEGDQLYGSLSVAVDQAEAEAAAGGMAPEPTPIDVQLTALAAGAEADRALLSSISNGVAVLLEQHAAPAA